MTKGWHMCFFCNLWNGWGEVETKKVAPCGCNQFFYGFVANYLISAKYLIVRTI